MKVRSDKCPSCGKQHVPGFAFCQRCGASLEGANGNGAVRRAAGRNDFEEGDSVDLNARLLEIIEQGRKTDAIRLYQEAACCDQFEAEAAIGELSKYAEFPEAASCRNNHVGTDQRRWLSRCVSAVRAAFHHDGR